jgi:hypothetical protein
MSDGSRTVWTGRCVYMVSGARWRWRATPGFSLASCFVGMGIVVGVGVAA